MIKIYMGWILIVASFISITINEIYGVNLHDEGMEFFRILLIVVGGLGIFFLWIWMLTDFFRGRDIKHRVAWGWMLILANWLAGVIYFIFVYSPRKKAEIKAEKIKIEKKGTHIPA